MYLLEKANVRGARDFDTDFSGGLAGSGGGIQPGVLLAVAIIALITAILVFIFVIQRKKSFKGRFANWIKEFLNFRSVLVAGIIKILYVFLAVFLTIMSIIIMFQGKGDEVLPMILTGLASLILGNILLRVMLELTMALIVVWENTSDIRLLLVKRDELLKGEDDKLPETKEPIDEKQPEVEELAVETSVEVEQPNFSQQPEAMQSELHQQQIPETPEVPNTPQSQAE